MINLRIIAWNSQGDRWANLWNHWAKTKQNTDPDRISLILESGWAPWVKNTNVTIGNMYKFTDTLSTVYDTIAVNKSTFALSGISTLSTKTKKDAFWIPWVKTISDLPTNSRCSMGAISLCSNYSFKFTGKYGVDGDERPILCFTLSDAGNNRELLKIFLVHFIANPSKAKERLNALFNDAPTVVGGIPAIVLGDINTDASKLLSLNNKWEIIKTGQATQQSMKELDYGFLFKNNTNVGCIVTQLERFKNGNNDSDHSVMAYDISFN